MTELPHGELIGRFRNLWRGRDVRIFDHPTNPARVITCGAPLVHGTLLPVAEGVRHTIWTDELRTDFTTYIGSFNKVYR